MKKLNLRIFLISVLILAIGCFVGALGVSALSLDGESVLSGLASVGTSLGIDIGGFISTTAKTTIPVYSGNAENDLRNFLDKIGFDFSETKIIDLADYLINRGGSFEDWIYDNYGDTVEIPSSVKDMSQAELVMFLMGNVLYPEQTAASTTKYVFTTKKPTPDTTAKSETTARTTRLPDTTKKESSYITGDVNGDGKVTANDARLALRASASLDKLTDDSFSAADVNGDGRVTAKDARSILRYSAKLSTGF